MAPLVGGEKEAIGMCRLCRFGAVSIAVLSILVSVMPIAAANAFASPLFQQQWRVGEAFAPNFWGPLSSARDGQQEAYADAPGGTRLVQYFDKARMELTNLNGPATNGLLARELILGMMQTGDATFQKGTPAAIPVAGDLDNGGPTYAAISANGSVLMVDAAAAIGEPTTRSLSATGTLGTYNGAYLNDPYAAGSHLEAATLHNVPKAFCDFRARVGLSSIGYAITEPFWSNVKVGGQQKDVLIQAFERRVLTYTPTNPDPYKIEFGNIGQHYYAWRGQPSTTTGATPPPPATAKVTGTVTYLERIALPPDAVVTIRLVDVSRADAPAVVLGAVTLSAANGSVPLPFTIAYDPTKIQPQGTYAVQADIKDASGVLLFRNTTQTPVITNGNPTTVNVVMQKIG